jgi:hypothetical protein
MHVICTTSLQCDPLASCSFCVQPCNTHVCSPSCSIAILFIWKSISYSVQFLSLVRSFKYFLLIGALFLVCLFVCFVCLCPMIDALRVNVVREALKSLLTVNSCIKVHLDLQEDKSPVVVKGPFFPRVVNPRYRILGTNVWRKRWSSKPSNFNLR